MSGFFSRLRAALPFASTPSTKGARGSRKGASSGWKAWATAEAERLYGPHNPLAVSDHTLALMEADWTIGMCLELWSTAYHGTEYSVEGQSDELNAFVEALWRRSHRRWIRVLLGALPFGRASAEIVWALEDVSYEYVGPRIGARDGARAKPTRKTLRSAFVVSDLRDYDPRCVEILVDERTGDFAGVKVPGPDSQPVTLSAREVLHVINDARWGDLRGRPLNLRSYSPWWNCNVVYLGANRYLEKKGDPPLIGYAPTEEEQDEEGNTQDPVKVTAIGLANVRGGGNYVLPSEVDPESKLRRYEARELQVAQRAEEFLGIAQHYEALKALGCCTFADQVGDGAFAGKKVGQRSQHRLFDERQHELILDPINHWLIPKVVRANFPNVRDSDLPRICGGSLAENAREVLAELAQGAGKAAAVTKDGRAVPVNSLVDWRGLFRALNVPIVDEDLIPDDLPIDVQRPEPGQPRAIATNPSRPEGPGERGMSLGFAAASAEAWLASARLGLARIDRIVDRAARAVERVRVRAEKQIRGIMLAAVREARTTETADGREVVSTRNRNLPARVEADVLAVLRQTMDGLLDEGDVDEAFAATPTPLGAAHAQVADAAATVLEAAGLPAPTPRARRRIVRDVTRDAKTNGRGVETREGRRVREVIDRLIQGGASTEHAEEVAQTWELPARDLESSTVAHVRASARAVLASDEVLRSPDLDGWAVLTGPGAEATVLERFPQGKAADLLYRSFPETAALDQHFEGLVRGGAVQTSWRNLGRTFGSPEMYVPVPRGLAEDVFALLDLQRRLWNERRRKQQDELEAERAKQAR